MNDQNQMFTAAKIKKKFHASFSLLDYLILKARVAGSLKKVLIITYYWPPETGVGVQRILKFCKYLPEFGFQPVVLTVAHPQSTDDSGINGVDVKRIFYWFDPVRWLTGNSKKADPQKKEATRNARSRISKIIDYLINFCWLNFFIPDSKIGWYLPGRKAVKSLYEKHHFAAILSTGPPYTAHLIGLHAKNNLNIPWVVDARDPWVENVVYNAVYRFGFVKRLNSYLERTVYNSADCITTVGEKIGLLIQNKVIDRNKVKVIYNGYDESEFENFSPRRCSRFKIGHYGSISLDDQLPSQFLRFLDKIVRHDEQFRKDFIIELYGPLINSAYRAFAEMPPENVSINSALPRHAFIEKMQDEQILLLLVPDNKESELVISSKIFEYIRAGWPVLIFGPQACEAASIISRTSNGKVFSYEDTEEAASFVMGYYSQWKKTGIENRSYRNEIFERKTQAMQLARIFDNLSQQKPKIE